MVFLMSAFYQLLFRFNRINCGKHLKIRGIAIIYRHPHAHISIGENVTLRGFCIIIARGVGEIFIRDHSELKNCRVITSEQVIY